MGIFAKAARRVSRTISDAAGQLKRTLSTNSMFGSNSKSKNPSFDGSVDSANRMSDVKRLQREILDHANNDVLVDRDREGVGATSRS